MKSAAPKIALLATSRKIARNSRPMFTYPVSPFGARMIEPVSAGWRHDGRLQRFFLSRLQFQFFKKHCRGDHSKRGGEGAGPHQGKRSVRIDQIENVVFVGGRDNVLEGAGGHAVKQQAAHQFFPAIGIDLVRQQRAEPRDAIRRRPAPLVRIHRARPWKDNPASGSGFRRACCSRCTSRSVSSSCRPRAWSATRG